MCADHGLLALQVSEMLPESSAVSDSNHEVTVSDLQHQLHQGLAIQLQLSSMQRLQAILQEHQNWELRMKQVIEGMLSPDTRSQWRRSSLLLVLCWQITHRACFSKINWLNDGYLPILMMSMLMCTGLVAIPKKIGSVRLSRPLLKLTVRPGLPDGSVACASAKPSSTGK